MLDVIVIGAGIAGMAAARECLAGGLSVRLLEARARTGGRLYAEETAQGRSLELGGQFFHLSTSPLVAAEIERHGIRTGAPLSCRKQLVRHGSVIHDLSTVFAERPGQLRRLVTTVRSLTLRLGDPAKRAELERLSVSACLAGLDLDPVIATWLRCWIEQYAGTSLDRISVANMLGLVEAAKGSLRSASHVSGEWIVPDTRALTNALADDISDVLRLEQAVTRVRRHPGGRGFVVELADGELGARSVIIAVPRNVLAARGIDVELGWPGGAPVAVSEPQPGLGYKAWVQLDERAPAATTVLGDLGGFRIMGTGEREADGSVWAVLFGSAASFGLNHAERAETRPLDLDVEARHAVEIVWGADVDVLGVRAHDWVADPFARGAWTVAPVQAADPIAELHASLPARAAFAGADFSTRRGGVESALASGIQAGARIVEHLSMKGVVHV